MTLHTIQDCFVAEERTFGQRSLFQRLAIITYEQGAVARGIVHGLSTRSEVEKRAYFVNVSIEIADAVTQYHLLLEELRELYPHIEGWEQLQQSGMERQVERMIEWEDRRAAVLDAPGTR